MIFNEQFLRMRGIVDYNKLSLTDEFFILGKAPNGKKNVSSYVKIVQDKGVLGWFKDTRKRLETDFITDLVEFSLIIGFTY